MPSGAGIHPKINLLILAVVVLSATSRLRASSLTDVVTIEHVRVDAFGFPTSSPLAPQPEKQSYDVTGQPQVRASVSVGPGYAGYSKAFVSLSQIHLQDAAKLDGNLSAYWQQASLGSFLVALQFNAPGYVSESIVTSEHSASGGPQAFAGGSAFIGFTDAAGRADYGHCEYDTTGSTQSCSTGLVPLAGDMHVFGSLDGVVVVDVPGDFGTVDYTYTVGDLNVYDVNKNLVQTIRLADFVAPEPATLALILLGLACMLLWKTRSQKNRVNSRRGADG